jgi:hypothetical protein
LPRAGAIPLSKFRWHRIVLDEGHEIISGLDAKRTSGSTYSICSLFTVFPGKQSVPILKFTASFYWFVSGTPFPSVYVKLTYLLTLSSDVMEGVLRFLIGEEDYLSIVAYLVALENAFPLHKYIMYVEDKPHV